MLAWIIVTVVVLVLVFLNLIFIKAELQCDLVYGQEEKCITLCFIPVWRRFQWRKVMEIPESLPELFQMLMNIGQKRQERTPQRPEHDQRKSKARVQPSLRNKLKSWPDYWRLFRLFMRHLVLENFDWKTRMGLDDAMHTALACGGLWAVKGNLIGLICCFTQLEHVDLRVDPVYSHSYFSTRLDCIFKIRIVYIMLIISYVCFIIMRGYWNGFTAGETEPSH